MAKLLELAKFSSAVYSGGASIPVGWRPLGAPSIDFASGYCTDTPMNCAFSPDGSQPAAA